MANGDDFGHHSGGGGQGPSDREGRRGDLLPRLQHRRRRAAQLRGLLLLLGLVGAALVAYLTLGEREGSTPDTAGFTADPTANHPASPAPQLKLTPEPETRAAAVQPADPPSSLDASDALVREAVGRLSSHDALLAWLISDDLIRRFTAAVDNIAEGKSPKPHLPFLSPERPFQTIRRDETITIDPASYARYDLATEVFESLDAAASVRLYRRLEPLVAQAYRELGYPEGEFTDVLERAIDELLRAPVVGDPVELAPRVISFAYRDPALEGLSAAQKQLLRMGPGNVRKIQGKLRQLAAEIGLSVDPALSVASPGGG
ncbi:MAG: DUF3014 domain-containing protein [Myxococcota bacterium]